MNTRVSPEDDLADSEENTHGDTSNEEGSGSRKIWMRLLFMLVFLFLYGVSRVVVCAVVVLQFFWVLFTEKTSARLSSLGQSLATYTYQILRYLTFNSEIRPFPFSSDWPKGAPE